jgi:twitching motility protein PilT
MDDTIGIFNKVLSKTRQMGASDVHLCAGTPWKYRIHGEILPIRTLPALKPDDTKAIARHVVESSRNVPDAELDGFISLLQDYDCSYSLPGVSRFRVNICRQRGSFAIVLRVVPFGLPTLETLGIPPVLGRIAMEESGLILVTGITGSGKSTTIAAMINLINQKRSGKIVTIEDPIEYLHKEILSSVVQREVGSDSESFTRALRASLRQDPDVIMLGEMRDKASMDLALKAAETGHLVLSTLHTLDASRTIQRIVSVFEMSEQRILRARLAETLKAVISQKLLRRCDNKGRVAVFEIMRNTPGVQDCIKDPEKAHALRDMISSGGSQYGMQTFDQHLMDLYRKGVIDMDTAKAAAESASDFEPTLSS